MTCHYGPACPSEWTGDGPHMCHHCHARPGDRRLYALPTGTYSISGMQAKASVRESHLCDECHAHNIAALKAAAERTDRFRALDPAALAPVSP